LRFGGSKQKRARKPHALDWFTKDARFEGCDVGGDVRQFWHGYQLASELSIFATATFAMLLDRGPGCSSELGFCIQWAQSSAIRGGWG